MGYLVTAAQRALVGSIDDTGRAPMSRRLLDPVNLPKAVLSLAVLGRPSLANRTCVRPALRNHRSG